MQLLERHHVALKPTSWELKKEKLANERWKVTKLLFR